ncbi:pyridoxamine 5'-phosphate oxidase family protein [Neobacillus muris]|uniref:pyridoxamine 5'-phosphate oxidase family protein n=1 Tax=Neobacillus muris TaxID=2941334 RepID=UPI00203AE8DA|nr:pyridoxamine 5'-phosphate oxidase family protein [Neobacillus muris]
MAEGKVFKDTVSSEEELRSIVGFSSELVKNKVIGFLDHHCSDFISRSPFMVISTSDHYGNCDVSPRGDMPGFVEVLNEKQLIIPDRPGNKRMDTMRNILSNPQVGLLFFIPGMGETLRVNGKAVIVKEKEVLDKMAINGKKPLLGIAVEVEECFMHCAKAFKRSGLWEPHTWPDKGTLPSPSKVLFDHAKLPGSSVDAIEKALEESYTKRLY